MNGTRGPMPAPDDFSREPERPLFALLDQLGIRTTTMTHAKVFTVAESQLGKAELPGGHTKNLFMKDKLGQLVLIGFTVAALVTLFIVVSRGLLGHPEMFLTGNGSAGNRLVWFAPAAGRELDRPWVFTVSIWFYRLLMLLWGLWLANAITRWLVMGWRQFTSGGAWRWRDRRVAG